MCVYSDSLDWIINFTPHFTLKYIENNGPSNCIICRLYQTIYPYLNTTQISAKLMFVLCVWKCLKVSLANFCSEIIIIY